MQISISVMNPPDLGLLARQVENMRPGANCVLVKLVQVFELVAERNTDVTH